MLGLKAAKELESINTLVKDFYVKFKLEPLVDVVHILGEVIDANAPKGYECPTEYLLQNRG